MPALGLLLLVDFPQPFLQQRDTVTDNTTVCFDFLLARAAHTDTAALLFEVRPHAGEAREQVLVLRELHLRLGVGGLRVLGENVEDEMRAVHHLAVHQSLDITLL